jgi:hypothetical protein
MNTKNKHDQKKERQTSRQKQGPKKQSQTPNMLQDDRKHEDHEHPETRLTR